MTYTDLTTDTVDPVAARVAELEAIKRRLVNVVGHELRTPVTTISGLAAELLKVDQVDEVRDVIGPALVRNAQRLTALLDDLLIASGIQTAIPVHSVGEVEITEEVQRIWSGLSTGSLRVAGGPMQFDGPLAGLDRTLQAVLDNAAAYGTDPPEITLSESGDVVTIAVRSPGPALHPEEVAMATQPFFRGERAVTTQPGLGIGLSIARAVVEASGGRITFDAVEGATVTTIELPRGRGRGGQGR